MKLNHNKFNGVLVFVLVLVREENRSSRVETTLLPSELLQSKNGRVCYLCMRMHFFFAVVNTSVLKELFYPGCQLHIT